MQDIDVFELNEAFASQAAYCVKELKIPEKKLNPKGTAVSSPNAVFPSVGDWPCRGHYWL